MKKACIFMGGGRELQVRETAFAAQRMEQQFRIGQNKGMAKETENKQKKRCVAVSGLRSRKQHIFLRKFICCNMEIVFKKYNESKSAYIGMKTASCKKEKEGFFYQSLGGLKNLILLLAQKAKSGEQYAV